jgi:hypothetical protein
MILDTGFSPCSSWQPQRRKIVDEEGVSRSYEVPVDNRLNFLTLERYTGKFTISAYMWDYKDAGD